MYIKQVEVYISFYTMEIEVLRNAMNLEFNEHGVSRMFKIMQRVYSSRVLKGNYE